MNARVDKGEHPNGCGHVSHAGPHAHHGAGVVVGLQGGAKSALGQNDEGIEDLIELAEVEDPAVESQALIPQPASVDTARQSFPLVLLLEVRGRIAESTGAVELAEAVHSSGQAIGAAGAHNRPPQSAKHAHKGPCRVNSEENVVQHDKEAEWRGFADSPRFLAGRLVVLVQKLRGDSVRCGDRDGDLGVQCRPENAIRDGKGIVEVWRRNRLWFRRRRKVEEKRRRRLEED